MKMFNFASRNIKSLKPKWRQKSDRRFNRRCRKAREAEETRACPRTDDVSEFIPQQQKEDKFTRRGKKQAKLPHTLALVPLVKRKVFCVGDRLKRVKHQAWAATFV